MRSIFTFCLLIVLSTMGLAQNESDVILYTSHEYGGTARFVSMGSSFGALGGDLSTLSVNPAGLAMYRSGEFTITPSVITSTTSTEYYGNVVEERDFNFSINNLGYAQVYELGDSKWKRAQFGFSFNRLRDFHSDYTLTGDQSESSLLDFVAAEALGVDTNNLFDFDPFYIEPVYFGFLINPFVDGGGGFFYEGAIPAGTEIEQQVSISNRGRVSETVFAGSANYDDRLYLGFSMGFQRAVRDELMRFTETVLDTAATDLDFFELNQDLEVRGDGINFKFGAIFRATDNIRIGGSYSSPTWYSFSNTWSTDWYSKFDDGDTYSVPSEAIGINDYRLRTPSRLTGSLGIIIGKQGLINVDYEYVNFSGAKFRRSGGSDIDFTRENVEIARQYTPVGNLRIGGEYRYNALSFRGGFGYYPSPYEAGLTISSADKYIYSGGIGYRKDRLNIDIAYRWTTFQQDYYPYDPDIVSPAAIQVDNYSILATLGVRF